MRYSVVLQWSEDDDAYVAIIPELPGCNAVASTAAEAAESVEEAARVYLHGWEDEGKPLPEPDLMRDFSGQLRIRIPKSLHARLVVQARLDGTSLNTHIVHLLSGRSAEVDAVRSVRERLAQSSEQMVSPARTGSIGV